MHSSAMYVPVKPLPRPIPMSIRWSLLLYAVVLPFESLDLGVLSGFLSIARIAGAFVIFSCLLHPRVSVSRPHPAFWGFAAYLVIHFVHGVLVNDPWYRDSQFVTSFLTRIQVIGVAWLICKPLRNTKLAVRTFLAFAIGASVLVVGMILGLPGFADISVQDGVERISALEGNPGYIGNTLALAMVLVMGVILAKGLIHRETKMLLVTAAVLLPIGIIMTRARGAILCLIVGVAFYLIPFGKFRRVMRYAPLILVGIGLFIIYALNSPEVMTRIERTINEGSVSGRDVILEQSLAMIAEKPFFGWGPVAWQRELGIGTHNHFVYLLLEGGIFGAAPYLFGAFLCWRSVWRARGSEWGKVMLAALVMIIVSNLNIDYPSAKPMWLVLTACLALSPASSRTLRRVA